MSTARVPSAPPVYLEAWRLHFNLSGQEVGSQLGITPGQVSYWEEPQRNWTLDKLIKFAWALSRASGQRVRWIQLLQPPGDSIGLWAAIDRLLEAHEASAGAAKPPVKSGLRRKRSSKK